MSRLTGWSALPILLELSDTNLEEIIQAISFNFFALWNWNYKHSVTGLGRRQTGKNWDWTEFFFSPFFFPLVDRFSSEWSTLSPVQMKYLIPMRPPGDVMPLIVREIVEGNEITNAAIVFDDDFGKKNNNSKQRSFKGCMLLSRSNYFQKWSTNIAAYYKTSPFVTW